MKAINLKIFIVMALVAGVLAYPSLAGNTAFKFTLYLGATFLALKALSQIISNHKLKSIEAMALYRWTRKSNEQKALLIDRLDKFDLSEQDIERRFSLVMAEIMNAYKSGECDDIEALRNYLSAVLA